MVVWYLTAFYLYFVHSIHVHIGDDKMLGLGLSRKIVKMEDRRDNMKREDIRRGERGMCF